MVEVYKTNVEYRETAEKLEAELKKIFPGSIVNFDLDDCDKILRVESDRDIFSEAAEIISSKGFLCKALE